MAAADKVINNLPEKRSSFNIGVISLEGDMKGSNVLLFKDKLFSCLYEGRSLQLIDFANVSRIDKHGIDALHNLLGRGMQLGLFNVSPFIKRTIIASNRNKCLSEKILDVNSREEAVSMFEEKIMELSKEKNFSFDDCIKKRPSSRVEISLSVEFDCDISHTHQAFCYAQTENISKNGMYVSQVHAPNGLIRKDTHVKGKDINNLSLNLIDRGISLQMQGVCVREHRQNSDNLCLGIRFKNLNEYCEDVLTGIVYDNTPLPNYLSYMGN